MLIGSYLRRRRVLAGLSVAKVSEATSIPKPTLYMWESVGSTVDPVHIRRVLTHYKARPEQIAYALALRSGDTAAVDPDPGEVEAAQVSP